MKKIYRACLSLITSYLLLLLLYNFDSFLLSLWQGKYLGLSCAGYAISSSDPFCHRPLYSGVPNVASKWGVLLTMCFQRDSVESQELHTALYQTVIKKWLEDTDLRIFVIETSGYDLNFDHDRLWYFTYDDPLRKKVGSSSILEANALVRAVEQIKTVPEARNITYILKVTGRYFLEGVEEQISKHADLRSPVLLLQMHRNEDIKWQNSEYFGIRKDALDLLGYRVLHSNQAMEESLFSLSNIFGYVFLGPGFPNTQPRGGDGLVINPL